MQIKEVSVCKLGILQIAPYSHSQVSAVCAVQSVAVTPFF